MGQALPDLRCKLEARVVARASSPGHSVGRARWVIERAVDLDRVKILRHKGERVELLAHARRIHCPCPILIVPACRSHPHLCVTRRRFEQRSLLHELEEIATSFTHTNAISCTS